VAEIEKTAARHGIVLAPLYNAEGAVADEGRCLSHTRFARCSQV
jgi:hypothetical protein